MVSLGTTAPTLGAAVCAGDVNGVIQLLANGADPNASFRAYEVRWGISIKHSSLPLAEAARRGYAEILDLLIAAGANVDAWDRPSSSKSCAIIEAAAKGHVECLRRSLDAGR